MNRAGPHDDVQPVVCAQAFVGNHEIGRCVRQEPFGLLEARGAARLIAGLVKRAERVSQTDSVVADNQNPGHEFPPSMTAELNS